MVVQSDDTRVEETAQFDEARLYAFLGRAVGDVGALGSAPLVLVGEQLGLYDALAEAGPLTSAALAPGGSVLVVEPMAGEQPAENLNPVGRVYSAASVLICTANALAGGGTGLGTLVPEAGLRQMFLGAGFGRFRRVAETPFNRVFEARH